MWGQEASPASAQGRRAMPAAVPVSGTRSMLGGPVGSEGGRQSKAPRGCLLVVPLVASDIPKEQYACMPI